MNELITSILHRPYVFAFLAAFLVLARMKWGWRRAIFWLVSGYFIAWASEVSSIHNGFPYGEYHYIYENLKGELLIAGVPFFDSLSYPFLIFAGFATAEFFLTGKKTSTIILAGAILTTLLDVIIDPIATMGDKWFLGRIHYYAHPGKYFGVPVSNFSGWFLVSFAVGAFNSTMWRCFPRHFNERRATSDERQVLGSERRATSDERRSILSPLFYISIALFNIAVSFFVGEWKLGAISSVILALVIGWGWVLKTRFGKSPNTGS